MASCPFDAARSGFVLSEGAAVLILESEELALKRGARIYGEIAGFGQTSDGYHLVHPHPEGIQQVKSMERALREAEID